MKKLTILVSMVLALSLVLATPVYAVPALPHAFYGSVTVNGAPAPPGTSVEARGTGVMTGIEDNPTVTTVSGIYGTSDPFAHRLVVQGDILDGTILTFYVNGTSTGQTAEWDSGETTELDLTVTEVIVEVIVEPPPAPTPAPTPPAPTPPEATEVVPGYWDVDEVITEEGVFTEAVALESADDLVQVTIAEDTVGLTAEGEPLEVITTVAVAEPPS
ncbi:hypothetical protein LCGC14_1478560, partial [marine sediment metagenome]